MTSALLDSPQSANGTPSLTDAQRNLRHNVSVETAFSAFNGVLLGLVVICAPVVAVIGVNASPFALTLLVSAFPVGAFLGPLWASVGRRWGMKRLVIWSAGMIAPLLLCMAGVKSAWLFVALLIPCQLLCIAIRMGQASLYAVVYPRAQRGRVLGRFVFWTYFTMVPSMLLTGWLLKHNPQAYRVLYPLTGACGLLAAFFYQRLRLPARAVSAIRPTTCGNEELRKLGRIFRNDRGFRLFELGFFLSGSSFLMSTHVILLLVQDTFSFDALQLSLWLTVIPQALLAVGSPWWGRIFDRLGITYCRLLVTIFLTGYLFSVFLGIVTGTVLFIYVGSILQGISMAGAQLTWFLASSHFAQSEDDVPAYNTIHFFLNGVRGLLLPLIGSVLLVVLGSTTVLIAALVSCAAFPFILQLRRYERAGTLSPSDTHSPAPLFQQGDHDDDPCISTGRRSCPDAHLQRSGTTAPQSEACLPGRNSASHVGGGL